VYSFECLWEPFVVSGESSEASGPGEAARSSAPTRIAPERSLVTGFPQQSIKPETGPKLERQLSYGVQLVSRHISGFSKKSHIRLCNTDYERIWHQSDCSRDC
jgi:hypothetical protein